MDAVSLVTSWWLPISRAGEPLEPPPPAWPARSPPLPPLPTGPGPAPWPSKFMYMPIGSEPFEEWLPSRFSPCMPLASPAKPPIGGAGAEAPKKRAPRGIEPSPTELCRSSSCHSPAAPWYGGAPAGNPA
jgi:hypothetical protein